MAWLLPWLLNRKESVVLLQNPDDPAALINLGIQQTRMVLIPARASILRNCSRCPSHPVRSPLVSQDVCLRIEG